MPTTRRVVPIISVETEEHLAAAREQYAQVLGLEVVMDHGWILTLAEPGSQAHQVSLLTQDRTASLNPVASIEVDDVDEAYRVARDQGLEIVHDLTDEDWGVRRFFFRDAAGNVVNVLSHLRN